MNNTTYLLLDWKVLDWNVRGLNDKDKRTVIYNKIDESQSAVVCLQETKCDSFDHSFIKSFCPKRFDRFCFSPSIGASGGLIVLWNSAIFDGQVIEIKRFSISITFTSKHNLEKWTLVSVYGPCRGLERDQFVQWLHDLDIPVNEHWLLVGDFNFIRSVDNRNKPGADMNDIFIFNEIISHLGLQELPLKGRNYTWSNMQGHPLLEQLDWFFTTANWTLKYPNSMVFPLAKPTSDHVPCVINISTVIPKAQVFRFENHWVRQEGFLQLVEEIWNKHVYAPSMAGILSAKFKNLRYALKKWGKSLFHYKGLISKCNEVILILDKLEEERSLSTMEFNFRNIVKGHLKKLLILQSDYWKSRCTIRWLQLGGENTKFFHAKAIERYRLNTISSIKNEDGSVLTDHQHKAAAFWLSFKGRMGISIPTVQPFDMREVLSVVDNLQDLILPFSAEELDGVVKFMKPDRAPSPDGFNGLFVKTCWPIIKEDFLKLCNDFYSGTSSLESINGSYITLVPKNHSPESVNDFRPISLTNTCLKFLTKILANRLQKVITTTIHDNQYGFIQGRTIQDCLAWAFEFIFQCQQSKNKCIILKIDFDKAFDTLDHNAILQVLEAKGFPSLFIKWVKEILSSGSSSVLLNGVPGKPFICKRGVRQGDPLSPLLFVEGADLLQSLVNKAYSNGSIQAPIPIRAGYPIVQYADDTIIVLPATVNDLKEFRKILDLYASFTGLRINFHKSSMIPLNVPADEVAVLASYLGCTIGSMPFTYLGLPMGTTKPAVKDFSPLIDRVERRLSATASFLSYGDRLVIVNSVLSSLPTYYMLTLKIPVGVIEVLDRARRHCLWRKKDKDRSHSLAAWHMICKPKRIGGLGIIDLKIQNAALLLKHLHKFFNNDTTPWVQLIRDSYYFDTVPHAVIISGSFWWRAVFSLADTYRQHTKCIIASGVSVLFWSDLWLEQKLEVKYPRLYSFTLDKLISVKEFLGLQDKLQAFQLPLSVQAFEEFQTLIVEIGNVQLQEQISDTWITLGKDGAFSPSKIYKSYFQSVPKDNPSCWIWKSKCQSKHKFFAWLLLHDRLNTKDMLCRRHWHVTEDHCCVLCPGSIYEDWRHLFFNCTFSTRVWNYLQIPWVPGSTHEVIHYAKKYFTGPCFVEVVVLACWCLWKQRNGLIFKYIRPSFRAWKASFFHEISLLRFRLRTPASDNLKSWLNSLP